MTTTIEGPKKKSKGADSALLIGGRKNDIKKVQQAIEQGADVNVRGTKEGEEFTAMYWALHKNNVDLVRLLLEHGFDAKGVVAPNEGTYLHMAAAASLECTRLLVERGADVNAVAKNAPVLAKAATPATLTYLLSKGAKASVDVLFGAIEHWHFRIVWNDKTKLADAEKMVEILLGTGIGINEPKNGLSPLAWAIEKDSAVIAQWFRARGAKEPAKK